MGRLRVDRSDLDEAVELTAVRTLARQQSDGSFSFCCEVSPFSDAMMVVFLNLMGEPLDPLISELCRTVIRKQHADGGWRAYPNQSSDVSISTLAYFALLLSGHSKQATYMVKARDYIRDRGGVNNASNLVKIFLATAGQIAWTDLPNPHLEAVLLDGHAPVNLYDFASFARLHIPSFMVLSHLNYHYNLPERFSVQDLISPKLWIPQIRVPYKEKEALSKCHTFILDRLEPNGTLASYMTATTMAVFALQALGYPRQHAIIQRAIRGLKDMVYRNDDFVHAQLFSSTVWDTALCLSALHSTRSPFVTGAPQRAAAYLVHRQQRRISDWSIHAPHTAAGGWGFSHVNTLFPDVDDTVAVLKAIRPFRKHYPAAIQRGLRWVMAMQNGDGGWSAFDRNSNKRFLEWIPINDMGRAMTDPSVPDITGRVLETLGRTKLSKGEHVRRAVRWLFKQQERDGSWFGRWGITYLYGTCAALRGLSAVGLEPTHPVVKRGLRWMYEIQRDDGGFGESCKSETVHHYVPLYKSTASQTAWGLMAMMGASPTRTKQIDRAVEYLLDHMRSGGGWKESYPTGAGVAGLAYLRYHSYPFVWPLLALSEYRHRYLQ